MNFDACRTERRPRRRHRRLAIALVLGCLMLGGCAQLVRDVAMVPIKAAESMAVETAKLPFRVAKATTEAAVDAVFRGR
jgi:hypothetical protein